MSAGDSCARRESPGGSCTACTNRGICKKKLNDELYGTNVVTLLRVDTINGEALACDVSPYLQSLDQILGWIHLRILR